MCYNKNVSIGTYILGIVGCYNLYINYGYKVEAIFFAWVVQMQLIEYILWENQTCNDTNKITTNVGAIVNHAEPVILWIAILLLSSKQLPHWVNLIMTIYIIVSIYYTKYILDDLKDDNCTNVTPESNPHLFWKWNNKEYAVTYYGFFLLCLNILVIYGVDKGYHLSILVNMSFLISGLIYRSKKSVGAMWCFIAAISPWIIPHMYQLKLSLN